LGIIPAVIDFFRRQFRHGRSAIGKRIYDYAVSARLVAVNDVEPDVQIVGRSTMRVVDEDPRTDVRVGAAWMRSSVRRIAEGIVIRVTGLISPVKKRFHGDD